MRDLVLGLEVVLADGRIMNNLKRLRKDNSGYATKHMFMGAEGTLGVITAACLRLFPKIENKVTAFASLSNLDATIQLLETLKSFSGELLSSYELIPKIGLDIALKYGDELVSPISDPQEWNVIIEYSDTKNNDNANDSLENALGNAIEKGLVCNAAIASSLSQAQNIWKIRKAIVEHQPKLGGEIKHDCSSPGIICS